MHPERAPRYLFVTAGVVWGEQPCRCKSNVLDCSNNTIIVESDIPSCWNVYLWTFRGSNLRTYPSFEFHYATKVDLSNTEIQGELHFDNIQEYQQTLDASFNYLNALKNSSNYCMLTTLNVSNNLIAEVGENRCDILSTFRLANNKITQLNSSMFTSWPNLKLLELSGNLIVHVHPDAFQGLSNLDELRLDNTNHLSTLSKGTFSSLTSLRYLSLAGNRLNSIPEGVLGRSLIRLEILELQRNRLRNLSHNAFQNLVSLRVLLLDDNELLHLPPALFRHLHSLEDLTVRFNHLTTLPSLHRCSGPLKTALFDNNKITEVSEQAVRSLLRHGFRVGHLAGNPLPPDSLQWLENVTDFNFSPGKSIQLIAKGHGIIYI